MIFSRTKAGLASEYLFHRSDLVIYCEGATIADDSSTLDELFWSTVFERNGLRVHCKSLGSKSKLLEMARQIIDEDVGNVAGAMDSDYDSFHTARINHPKVLYTFGYSWESDAIVQFNFTAVANLFFTIAETRSLEADYAKFILECRKPLKRICALDIRYSSCPHAIFDRQKPQSIIHTSGASAPHFKVKSVLEKVKTIRHFEKIIIDRGHWDLIPPISQFYGKSTAKLGSGPIDFATQP